MVRKLRSGKPWGMAKKKSFGTVILCVVELPIGYPFKFFCFILFLVLRDLFFPI